MPVSYNVNLRTCFRRNAFDRKLMSDIVSEVVNAPDAREDSKSILDTLRDGFKAWKPAPSMAIKQDSFGYFSAMIMLSTWVLTFEDLRKDYTALVTGSTITTVEDYITNADHVKSLIREYYKGVLSLGYSIIMAVPRVISEFDDALKHTTVQYPMSEDQQKAFCYAFEQLKMAIAK